MGFVAGSFGLACSYIAFSLWRARRRRRRLALALHGAAALRAPRPAAPAGRAAVTHGRGDRGKAAGGSGSSSPRVAQELEEGDVDVEIPDEFKDPISLSVIREPVVLTATGQVYCYTTLKEWFQMGSRICPRTNIEVLDVQITPIPWLKQKIRAWCEENGVELPEGDGRVARLRAINPRLPGLIADIRCDSGVKRLHAASEVFELMRKWERYHSPPMSEGRERLLIRDAVMDEMVWLVRYGDPHLQGVAASILAYCDTPVEVQWLAPTACVPACMLLLSPNLYTSQAATRLVYNITRSGPTARRCVRVSGGARALLHVVSLSRTEYGYSRDRAAAAISCMAKDDEAREFLKPRALPHLLRMATGGDGADRWEQRDAATALLALQYTQEELGNAVTLSQLFYYFLCSRAWLEARAESPSAECTPAEARAQADISIWVLTAGEVIHRLMAPDLVLPAAVAEVAAGGAEAGGVAEAAEVLGAGAEGTGIVAGQGDSPVLCPATCARLHNVHTLTLGSMVCLRRMLLVAHGPAAGGFFPRLQ
ncbi:hypothetical protein FOA52_004847 [Chlamydomonas sp. UWO 241]|nr:hypothetical protein FOA52_004847 [Chlamydomonas sp. UWO 241]